MAEHPVIDKEVLQTAQLACASYMEKNLPLLNADTPHARFQQEAEKIYAAVLNGGVLEGSKKPGDKEAKIPMHIKTVSLAIKAIDESSSQFGKISAQTFNSSPVQDVLLFYFDLLHGSSINGDEHSIFTNLTRKFEDRFMQDVRDLNVLDPDEVTRVTEYGPQIIDFVDKVVQNNFAYTTPDGSVYFDIKAFEAAGNTYTRLEPWNRGNQPLVADAEGSLTEKRLEKRSQTDFALWKASRPGEPSWPSPWGRGRPGWHIECSAMASDRLGKQIDIHSGGIDLAFPHHDNELAQSEAYWYKNDGEQGSQWVNYFMHIGHLSISGAKMSKSLKNFTTIREALQKGTWTARSLRIVFLLGGWREGIEITAGLVETGNAWEEKVNNFFLNIKGLIASEGSNPGTDGVLTTALRRAQDTAYESLLDSFNTPKAMNAISDLVSEYNNADKLSLSPQETRATALWITSMVNVFGLNRMASPDGSEIGWEGIDIPEAAKPFVYPLSVMRDSLREIARSKDVLTLEKLKEIGKLGSTAQKEPSDMAKPYADLLSNFRDEVHSLGVESNKSQDIMALCDRVRDIDLFDLGIYLEDRENQSALVRPVSKDLIRGREEKAEKARQKQLEKEKREQEALQKAEKGKMSHLDIFRTSEFSAWDGDGVPIKDAAGEELAKSRIKKLRKDWERQKRLHEAWLASRMAKTSLNQTP